MALVNLIIHSLDGLDIEMDWTLISDYLSINSRKEPVWSGFKSQNMDTRYTHHTDKMNDPIHVAWKEFNTLKK